MTQPPDKPRSKHKEYSLRIMTGIQVAASIITILTVSEKLPVFPLNDGVNAQNLYCPVQVENQ